MGRDKIGMTHLMNLVRREYRSTEQGNVVYKSKFSRKILTEDVESKRETILNED